MTVAFDFEMDEDDFVENLQKCNEKSQKSIKNCAKSWKSFVKWFSHNEIQSNSNVYSSFASIYINPVIN